MHTRSRLTEERAAPRSQAALHSYLDDFGHDEADVLRQVKALIDQASAPDGLVPLYQ